MARVKDWVPKLHAAIEKHRALPFAWGGSDCFLFPLDCAEAMLAESPARAFPGHRDYRSEAGAAKKFRKFKCRNTGDAFARLFAEIPPSMAGRGDVVVVIAPNGTVGGGVCIGSHVLCKAPDVGLSFVARSAATRAFRVG